MVIKVDLKKGNAEFERVHKLLEQYEANKNMLAKKPVHEEILGLLTEEQRESPVELQRKWRDEWD